MQPRAGAAAGAAHPVLPNCTHSIPVPAAVPPHTGSSPFLQGLEGFHQAHRRSHAPLQPPRPTRQLLCDVQAGAPGEALHRPVLQSCQRGGQSPQLVRTPLLPVQEHPGAAAWRPGWPALLPSLPGARGGLARPAPRSRAHGACPAGATGGTSRGGPAPALRAGPGLRTSGAFIP